ncbi:hypothetical protein Fcan01_15426 [Folsomia candida]|uniref:Uncharacterized protein n=1 Tax=Folsomia candida TaxID=158441 RepID=A0A226DVK0_FOLCA|nr:hypothetical protein Fcan01_15426 [Folsomia candida]
MYTVSEYDSVIYKIAESNLTSKNNANYIKMAKKVFKDSIRRTVFYRKKRHEKKCHLVKEPIVQNEPSIWTFKRDRGGGFIKRKTNQMFEHGLTALWYDSYEREVLTRPNLKNGAFLDITYEVPKVITQPRLGCTWKYSIIGRDRNTSNRLNMDKLFFESATPKFPIVLEDFIETRTTDLDMSSFVAKLSNQCKVHVAIVKHSSSLSFPKVSAEDNAKTLVHIVPDGWLIPGRISRKYWRRSIDNIRDIFVLNVDYDRTLATRLRAFQQRPTYVLEYNPFKETIVPNGNFKLSSIWVFEPNGPDRDMVLTIPINSTTMSKLYAFPSLIAPRFIVLLELMKHLNFTPLFVLDYELVQKEHKQRGGVLLSTIYTPKMFSYGFGLSIRNSNMNPLVTTYLKIREEALHILYCENDPDPYTPSAFSAMLFRAFDYATWICLLVTYFFCALTTKLVSPTDAYPFFGVVCIFFRQSVSKFKQLHLIVSLVFIPILFPYEADITARVIAPDQPSIYNNFKELLNSSYAILVNRVNLGGDLYSVNEYDSVIYKMAEANMTAKNQINFNTVIKKIAKVFKKYEVNLTRWNNRTLRRNKNKTRRRKGQTHDDAFQIFDAAIVKTKQGCIQDSIRRTLYYRNNKLERKCHLVKEPIVPNEPIIWTFKRDCGGGFIRMKTNQMLEHGLTALWVVYRTASGEPCFRKKGHEKKCHLVKEPIEPNEPSIWTFKRDRGGGFIRKKMKQMFEHAKYWRRSIDNIRDIFVLNVDYDRTLATRLRAFQQRPTYVLEYNPFRKTNRPNGNFKLSGIWVFEPDGADRDLYVTTLINPTTLPKLNSFPSLIAPRFIILLELKKYLNFTPLFVLDYELAQKEHKQRRGVLLSTIYTPKMFSYGFGLSTRYSNMNPLVTTCLKIRGEVLYILYCENDPDPYTPSAFSAMLFRAFDTATWICLLVTYFLCALTTKFVSRTDAYPFFSVVCIFFRQSVSKFKPLHLIVSLVFIPVLFPYEADITARVVAPDEPTIYANFEKLIYSSFSIFVNLINIGNDKTVFEYDSDRIRRTLYYRKNQLERKCHLVKEPIVRNEPIIWTFKRDCGGGFIRKKTNQMFEHGLTALWYDSYEREVLTRPNLKNGAFLDITYEVLKIRKVAFAFVTGLIFIAICIVVAFVEKIYHSSSQGKS